MTSFQEIRTEWENLLSVSPVNSLFLTPQWQEVWWDTFGNGKGLAGFYLRTPEGVTAIASLARHGDTLSFVGNQDTFDYNDFMVSPGFEDAFQRLLGAKRETALVSTGDTLKANGLVEIEQIAAITSRLAVNRAAWKTRPDEIGHWITKFRGAVDGDAA